MRTLVIGALCLASLVGCSGTSVGTIVQDDKRAPQAWRALSAAEKTQFDLGLAVFNTQWNAAQATATRTDGVGPVFNVPSCDGCHNSRRRGRGPRNAGAAPADLVIQLGRLLPNGSVERGTAEYGHVLNTNAVKGLEPEGSVRIAYDEEARTLADGHIVSLRVPHYTLTAKRAELPPTTVVMPRMPPPIFGVGLLERVPESALLSLERAARRSDRSALLARIDNATKIGRFGWQSTSADVASQTASAFAREMGLTTAMIDHDDCGSDLECRNAPSGGAPEVDPALFDALIAFQTLHAVPAGNEKSTTGPGARVFVQIGCDSCHQPTLPVESAGSRKFIEPFTDLLLHDLGTRLADRDLAGNPVPSVWRTAPLWGINASVTSGQPLRLLHDGRARSVEEAILWHDGAATAARSNYERLDATARQALIAWIEKL